MNNIEHYAARIRANPQSMELIRQFIDETQPNLKDKEGAVERFVVSTATTATMRYVTEQIIAHTGPVV